MRKLKENPSKQKKEISTKKKKDFLPIALGFWGIALPLFISVFVYCETWGERITVGAGSLLFFILGWIIYKQKL